MRVDIDKKLFFDKFNKRYEKASDIYYDQNKNLFKFNIKANDFINLYIKEEKINFNKTEKFACKSILEEYRFEGKKGKKVALDKKSVEAECLYDIEKTEQMIQATADLCFNECFKPIQIESINISAFNDDFSRFKNRILFNRIYTLNRNKLLCDFLLYIEDGKVFFEFDKQTIWFNSRIAYL